MLINHLLATKETIDEDVWVIIHVGGNDLLAGMDDMGQLIATAGLAVLHQPSDRLHELERKLRVLIARLHLTLGVRNLILSGMPLSPELPCVRFMLAYMSHLLGMAKDVWSTALDEESPLRKEMAWHEKAMVGLLLGGLNSAHKGRLHHAAREFRRLVIDGARWARLPLVEPRVLCVDEARLLEEVLKARRRRLRKLSPQERELAHSTEELWLDPLHLTHRGHAQIARLVIDKLARRFELQPPPPPPPPPPRAAADAESAVSESAAVSETEPAAWHAATTTTVSPAVANGSGSGTGGHQGAPSELPPSRAAEFRCELMAARPLAGGLTYPSVA